MRILEDESKELQKGKRESNSSERTDRVQSWHKYPQNPHQVESQQMKL